ncbi:MAG: metallophosphoesterase [bacterium]|nr:metallophosphoesterase [bacterium]
MNYPGLAALLALAFAVVAPHGGPDPIGSWLLSGKMARDGRIVALLGVDAKLTGKVEFVKDAAGSSLWFDGESTRVVLADDFSKSRQKLPKRHLTIDAWVAINAPQRWGGIFGCVQDNGYAEQGWVLGYDEQHFTFGLASKGADDGDGRMTYVAGKTKYREGVFYHVAATYDGKVQRLYVNGVLEAESKEQSGDILYPKNAPLVVGAYRDSNEEQILRGRVRSVRLFDKMAKAPAIRETFEHQAALTKADAHIWIDPEHRWIVRPYLQWATTTGMTVRWETSRPASSVVHFDDDVDFEGEGDDRIALFDQVVRGKEATRMHELRIDGLRPDTPYYYRVESADDLGRKLESPVLSFQTAPGSDGSFAFAVISDTQGNPNVSGAIAKQAWAMRPHFVLHPGDLVSTGTVKEQWVSDFFASMQPLLERVALFPVLGNHERDARFYYDYMSLPEPEYYYAFDYGNARFFLIDSNREVGPGSEQYRWLERELAAAKERKVEWKIVCYHHPAYTSDENDYGDTWSGPSTRGDLRVRKLVPLYDEYGVDVVWNGHIHSYERTWPLRDGKAGRGGTTYMITGGGGGSLETPGPIRPFFQNTVKRGHHFCFVAVAGRTLELKAYDLEGRLFDTVSIEKR